MAHETRLLGGVVLRGGLLGSEAFGRWEAPRQSQRLIITAAGKYEKCYDPKRQKAQQVVRLTSERRRENAQRTTIHMHMHMHVHIHILVRIHIYIYI